MIIVMFSVPFVACKTSSKTSSQDNSLYFERDIVSDNGKDGGIAGNGLCDGKEACIYVQKRSGILWNLSSPKADTFENAQKYCKELSFGEQRISWRLPTDKELSDALSGSKGIPAERIQLGNYWVLTDSNEPAILDNEVVGGKGNYSVGPAKDNDQTALAICVK
jgi:hypothetical protein